MEIKEFIWARKVIYHIARHNVSPEEIEEVAFDDKPYITKGREGLRYLYGTTNVGGYLFTVYRLYEKGKAAVITARSMTDREKSFYKRKVK